MNVRNKILLAALLGLGAFSYFGGAGRSSITYAPGAQPFETLSPETMPIPAQVASTATDTLLAQAFQQRLSNYQITGAATVSRLLPDDNDGSRHQKFLLQTANGQTVLVAHNIDLAPRIANLQAGDTVEFYGEYEWNEKGGVIHWTHHDPDGRHAPGWLRHRGNLYQ